MAVAKKAGAKKVATKKVAAKKASAKSLATGALAGEQVEFSVGDVVIPVGDNAATGAGRVCRVLNFDRYCVNFSDVGCRRLAGPSLRSAPPGTDAPDCTGCTNC
jgi:hypothetical protein